MSDKKLKKPIIFVKPNQCPNCLGTLMFKEVEFYEAHLNDNGIPGEGVTYSVPCLVCTKCNSIFDCEKIGLGYRIDFHLPKIKPIMKKYNPFYK